MESCCIIGLEVVEIAGFGLASGRYKGQKGQLERILHILRLIMNYPANSHERRRSMDEATFEKKLDDLINEIGSMPKPQKKRLMILAEKTRKCHEKLKKSTDRLQESLDYLRVSVKYLLFDLEATRRENAYLKKLLEDNSR